MVKRFLHKKKKKNRKKGRKLSPYKRGLKIGCINTRGLVSCPTKRIDLNNWMPFAFKNGTYLTKKM